MSFDLDLFAKALRRLVGEVERLKGRIELVEEENGRLRRTNDEFAGHLLQTNESVMRLERQVSSEQPLEPLTED